MRMAGPFRLQVADGDYNLRVSAHTVGNHRDRRHDKQTGFLHRCRFAPLDLDCQLRTQRLDDCAEIKYTWTSYDRSNLERALSQPRPNPVAGRRHQPE